MKRGAWNRIVDATLWYTQRPIASARLPGRNSARGQERAGGPAWRAPGSEKQSKDTAHVASTSAEYS
jgi:hypothetical protein